MECLILVAERNGPTMLARIGIMRALNRRVERMFNPDRKDAHWGRQNLARNLQQQTAACSSVSCSRRLHHHLGYDALGFAGVGVLAYRRRSTVA
jgi:hypothetical protein